MQMFGNVVRGIPSTTFEQALKEARDRAGVSADSALGAEDLRKLTATFTRLFEEATGDAFPHEPREQLRQAITAVFDSWEGERAVAYRRINGIPDDWGTAVSVQQMVFGNRGDSSGSGVAFSRDERTGAPTPSGEFLPNAQGEDVVSGTRDPEDLAALADHLPEAHAQLLRDLAQLESHYKDMQDVDFTIEDGRPRR
jgi:pyruvate,orthophosphate dikinase